MQVLCAMHEKSKPDLMNHVSKSKPVIFVGLALMVDAVLTV